MELNKFGLVGVFCVLGAMTATGASAEAFGLTEVNRIARLLGEEDTGVTRYCDGLAEEDLKAANTICWNAVGGVASSSDCIERAEALAEDCRDLKIRLDDILGRGLR